MEPTTRRLHSQCSHELHSDKLYNREEYAYHKKGRKNTNIGAISGHNGSIYDVMNVL